MTRNLTLSSSKGKPLTFHFSQEKGQKENRKLDKRIEKTAHDEMKAFVLGFGSIRKEPDQLRICFVLAL